MFRFIKTLTISALFFLTASTSVAMANDIVPADPQGAVIELDAGSIHETTEQDTSTSTNETSTDVNEGVMDDLRSLNEMARNSARPGAGW